MPQIHGGEVLQEQTEETEVEPRKTLNMRKLRKEEDTNHESARIVHHGIRNTRKGKNLGLMKFNHRWTRMHTDVESEGAGIVTEANEDNQAEPP